MYKLKPDEKILTFKNGLNFNVYLRFSAENEAGQEYFVIHIYEKSADGLIELGAYKAMQTNLKKRWEVRIRNNTSVPTDKLKIYKGYIQNGTVIDIHHEDDKKIEIHNKTNKNIYITRQNSNIHGIKIEEICFSFDKPENVNEEDFLALASDFFDFIYIPKNMLVEHKTKNQEMTVSAAKDKNNVLCITVNN